MCIALRLLFLLAGGVPYEIQEFTFLPCINKILTSVSSVSPVSGHVDKEEHASMWRSHISTYKLYIFIFIYMNFYTREKYWWAINRRSEV